MTNAPAEVVLYCSANGDPMPGAYATLRLPMWNKNQYVLLFGPSDDEGMIRVSGDELTRRANAEQAMFPMDYATFPAQWSGGLGAEVLTLEGVEQLREAMATWGADLYPKDLDRELDHYETRLTQLEGAELGVEVARTD
jgi:hypothetical protein